jgi:N4-gp56 family major capsid protein
MATIVKPGSGTLSTPVLAGGITNGSITTTTDRPYSLATMDVDSGLLLDIINRKLQIESTLDDVFVDLGAEVSFNGGKVAIPDACVMKVSSEKGPRTQVMPIANPLAGAGVGGTAESMQGNERATTLQYMKIYYNEFSQGVIGEKWGVNYNDKQVFNYYQNEQPALSKWFKEDRGKQYREALLERYAWPLTKTGTALTQSYNPNWFIANTDFADNDAIYNATPATMVTNLDTALAAADTGTNGVNANISLDYLIYLSEYAAKQKRTETVNIGGQESYVVCLPSSQYLKLLQDTSGQLGGIWTKVADLSGEEQRFPGIVGRVMNLVIVKDTRYPTITTNYAGTHSVVYVEPGNIDNRPSGIYDASTNATWEIGYLLGKGAIIDWLVTPLHFEMEETEYGKIYGKAAFTEEGIQLGNTYDLDTAGAAIKNFGSIALAFTAASNVTVA